MSVTNEIAADNRLAFLRAGDEHRTWRSLDDRRICMRCTKVFSGAEVKITLDHNARPTLHCPSDGCDSTPRDWFFYGSGLASDAASARHSSGDGEIDFSDL